ncbi:hypothetical protein H8959_004488 [Pygathrix nigripes]
MWTLPHPQPDPWQPGSHRGQHQQTLFLSVDLPDGEGPSDRVWGPGGAVVAIKPGSWLRGHQTLPAVPTGHCGYDLAQCGLSCQDPRTSSPDAPHQGWVHGCYGDTWVMGCLLPPIQGEGTPSGHPQQHMERPAEGTKGSSKGAAQVDARWAVRCLSPPGR